MIASHDVRSIMFLKTTVGLSHSKRTPRLCQSKFG